MNAILVCLLTLAGGIGGTGLATAERAKLFGSWALRGHRGELLAAWVITPAGAGIHVLQMEGGKTLADFECSLEGKECKVGISGRTAFVSFYYDGLWLVELEMKGDRVLKRHFSVLPAGTEIRVETIPLTKEGKPGDCRYQREEVSLPAGQIRFAPIARGYVR